uniref:Uncharacterized protein n=1 Tax=Pyxicephalus adspersus TaxID=30357 RepID=A0AAV2ZW18_PYXAD|nr:TPA: hypothetical protein GDO54_002379 [Pyxicephalus adspersus]
MERKQNSCLSNISFILWINHDAGHKSHRMYQSGRYTTDTSLLRRFLECVFPISYHRCISKRRHELEL